MELIKRNTEYGLRALLHMIGGKESDTFTAEELADAADTSTDFMHKIMRALRDVGIVSSKTGPSGGFQLDRDPSGVSVLEILEAVQGPFRVNQCVIGLDICPTSEGCPLRPTWLEVQKTLEENLGAISLKQIADRAC